MVNILKIARAQFLLLALALFIFGVLVAVSYGQPFSWSRMVLGALIVLSAQLSVHFSNDYFDIGSDQPGGTTLVSGGSGVLLAHPELRGTSKRIAIGLILFSLGTAVVFMLVYDLPVWFLGLVLAANLIGWVYSAPPLRLAMRGLGEICCMLVVGFLVPVVGYAVITGRIDAGIMIFVPPILLYGLVLILTVQIPDLEDDVPAGKRNWIVRFGREFGFTVVGLSLLGATAYFFFFPSFVPRSLPFDIRVVGLLSLLALLPGLWGLLRRPQARRPATLAAVVQIISLAVFTILVDGYLLMTTMD